jgi:flagellar export protein FliJ
MSTEEKRKAKRLQALERWRSAELDEAQAQHVVLEVAAAQKETERDRVRAELDETQSLARERLTVSEPLAADSLRRFAEFAAVKGEELASAQHAVDDSRALCASALTVVVQKFEQLSIVQKLGERRAAEAVREAGRKDQKRLDEQALSRLAAGPPADDMTTKE